MSMDLREMFDELATDREPPTRLSADNAYTAGRRRTRVRALTSAALAAAAVAGAVVAVTTLVGPPKGTPAPAGSSDAAPVGAKFNGVTWATAVDAKHLYAAVLRCPDNGQLGVCPRQLLGSDDGGRTWTVRSTTDVPGSAYFAGPNTLVAQGGGSLDASGFPRKNSTQFIVTTDGGRHWHDITEATTPVTSVPSGGFAACGPETMATNGNTDRLSCTVYAVDPAARRAAPLANQPAVDSIDPSLTVTSLGGTKAGEALWVTGWSGGGPGAGLSVAVSQDAGRTWRTTAVDPSCVSRAELWHSDGATAKVICPGHKDGTPHVFSTDDYGARWREMALPGPLPFVNATDEYGIRFTVDGTVLGLQFPMDESGVRLWTLPDGSPSWVRIVTTGLAPYAQVIENTPDGGYVAYSDSRDKFTFYRSSDLRTWTAVRVGEAR